MGCDIHLFGEVKIDGQWYLHSVPNIERWYQLFEKMAGVRGNVENAISPPKGLPDDLSVVVKKYAEYWKGDAHSASWLNQDEIKQLEDWLNEKAKQNNPQEYYYPEKDFGYLFSSAWSDKGEKGHMIEDARFVFWFDN